MISKAMTGQGIAHLQLRVAESCRLHPAPPEIDELVSRLRATIPELTLGHVMSRGGWHRLGGVVDGDYRRVAQHIRTWSEGQSDGDVELLLDKCSELHGFVTRLEGLTHYLTAPTGEGAGDFIQVEIEQLQEVIDRTLWDPDWLPDDLEEFIDPMDYPRLEPEPVGAPRLLCRRVLPVRDFLGSEDADRDIKRFFSDWERSSAGESAHLCDHWCLGIREFLDIGGEGHLKAKPVAVGAKCLPDLPEDSVARGSGLANLIHGFDRTVGYHFAWFFHMLTRRRVSFKLAEAVHADQMGAFDYLPARDLAVLRDWYDRPYSL